MATNAFLTYRFDPSETIEGLITLDPLAVAGGRRADRTGPDFEYISWTNPFPHSPCVGTSARLLRIRPHLSFAPLQQAHASGRPNRASRPLTILTVDPCRDTCSSFEELFQLWGYECHIAHDGRTALSLLGHCHPDVLLMDIVLPDMDGIDLVRRVRQSACCRPYLVCLSAWDDQVVQRRASAAGCDCFLSKPLELSALQQLLSGANLTRR